MQRENRANQLRFIIFWLVAFMFEIPFTISLFGNFDSVLLNNFPSNLAMHAMSATTMFFSFEKGNDWFSVHRKWPKLFFFLTLFIPVFGLILSLFLFFFGHPRRDPKLIFEEDENFFASTTSINLHGKAIQFSKQITEGLDFVPLSDILAGQDIELKRGAIERLAQLANPEAIALLLQQRSDSVAEVRFFATSALTRIKKNFDDKLEAARLEMQKNIYKLSARVFLAKTYLQYVESNLLDATIADGYIQEACFNLRFATESDQVIPEAHQILFDIYIKHNKWSDALATIERMKDLNLATESDVLKTKIRMTFDQRNYETLGSLFKELIKLPNLEADWLATANWWNRGSL